MLPLNLMAASGSANFVVTLEETRSPTRAHRPKRAATTVSGVLTTDSRGTGINGRTVVFTLGAARPLKVVPGDQRLGRGDAPSRSRASPGADPHDRGFASDGYYRVASAASTVNLPEGTQLNVNPTRHI